ncbi:MAG: methyltransferase domain-containing protein [Oligoflexia bacterium]|nr:methyltransferase domain-containing protein [Oligoflexia bacterium]
MMKFYPLLLLLAFSLCNFAQASDDSIEGAAQVNKKARASKLMAVTGDSDFADEKTAWDKTYSRKDYVFGKDPVDFLQKNIDSLPKGRALDIATGEGRNAVFLAKKGFSVDAVDISKVGLKKAQKLASEHGVKIQTINADLNRYEIPLSKYNVILNFFYLQRNLIPKIKKGLLPGGVVVFETYTTDQLKIPGASTWEKEYLLKPGELKKMFSGFEILKYQENNDGKSATARLIARKPKE